MIRSTLAALSVLAAGPASALSCVAPDVARSFIEASEAEEVFVVLHGSFDVPGGGLPAQDPSNPEPQPVTVGATFRGGQLQGNGSFSADIEVPVTLAQLCFGPWCGQLETGRPVLAFARQTAEGLVLDVSPCPQWALVEPTDAMLETLSRCVTGGDCRPEF